MRAVVRQLLVVLLRHGLRARAAAPVDPGRIVTEQATPHLDGRHTVFGRCKEVDLVKKIARVPTGANDMPSEPVVMKKVTISRGK